MNSSRQSLLYAFAGLFFGCCLGFWVANVLAKSEQQQLRGRAGAVAANNAAATRPAAAAPAPAPAAASSPKTDDAGALTDEEIRQAVARADADPQNREIQLNLGRALYFYAVQSRSARVLPEAARLLRRAREAQPNDQSTLVLLANVLADLGQASDSKYLSEAREHYLQALKAKPGDADLLVGVGRTYYYERPAQTEQAIAAYRRALAANPRHEAALQNLVNALLETKNLAEAERRLNEIESVNAENAMLPTLRARYEQLKNAGR